MARTGPIIIIEDDVDDQDIICEILRELNVRNEVKVFENGLKALEYLRRTEEQPFLILCDINMPQVNGIQVRDEINNDEYLKNKSIPFIFLTTTANRQTIKAAYCLSVQGFFQKPSSLIEMKSTLKEIVDYWKNCKHPNSEANL